MDRLQVSVQMISAALCNAAVETKQCKSLEKCEKLRKGQKIWTVSRDI